MISKKQSRCLFSVSNKENVNTPLASGIFYITRTNAKIALSDKDIKHLVFADI